jgi:hypothetical protein
MLARTELNKKVKPVCNHCGSSDLMTECYVDWNIKDQAWEIVDLTKNVVCNKCGRDCDPKWVVVKEGT